MSGGFGEVTASGHLHVSSESKEPYPAEVLEKLAQEAPDANLTTLPGIGHMPHHVAPDAVEAAIDRAAAKAGLL